MSYFKILLNVGRFGILLLKTQKLWMPAAVGGCTCCLSHRFEDDSEANGFHR